MRTFTSLLIMTFIFLSLNAQQIWTEGTTWEIYVDYYKGSDLQKTEVHIYELGEPVSFNDTIYYTLTETCEGISNIVSYLRSEGEDAYVYARKFQSEELGIYTGEEAEILLYDFSKPFEYGDSVRYSIYGGYMIQEYIDPRHSHFFKNLYDVIETGDCMPIYDDIIYKIGSIFGPISHLYAANWAEEDSSTPNSRNVSHVLFKTKGKPQGSMISLSIERPKADNQPCIYYSLSGMSNKRNQTKEPIIFKKNNVIFIK